MDKWKLIALDMDGTTLSKDGSISEANRAWISKAGEAGVQVTFATGRHLEGVVRHYIEDLHCQVPVVTLNGGEVWTTDGQLLARQPFPEADIKWLFDLARKNGLSYWGATALGMLPMDAFPATMAEETWLKFGVYGEDGALIRKVWSQIQADGRFEISNSHPLNIEVNPRGVTKATGLQVVCDYLGIEARQVVTMGDSLNDVAMLQWAGLGIAMDNAQPAVKEVADVITCHSEDDGVAKAIEKYVLA